MSDKKPPYLFQNTEAGKAGKKMTLPAGAPLHACMGLNHCKGQDRYGVTGTDGTNPNNCAGQGYCATTATHSCHTNNNCANQGGCGLYGWGPDLDHPGLNECRSMGSCASPINAERFITTGNHRGMSVWKRAREVFAAAYAEKQAQDPTMPDLGKPPEQFGGNGPDYKWISAEPGNDFAACGSSGLSGGGSCS